MKGVNAPIMFNYLEKKEPKIDVEMKEGDVTEKKKNVLLGLSCSKNITTNRTSSGRRRRRCLSTEYVSD